MLWQGKPAEVLNLARERRITPCISTEILGEFENLLERTKLQSRLEYWGYTIEYLIAVVQELSESYAVELIEVPQLRDPDDAIVLATAIAAGAAVIVTGDGDLLTLTEFSSIPILTPTDFLERYFS